MEGQASSLPYVALLVVVLGWFVSNAQANRREDRKEARASVDLSKKMILTIGDDALKYLCGGPNDIAVLIKSNLDALEVELSRMPHFRVRGAPLMGRLIDFQDAITGGDFETADRSAKSTTSAEVAQVLRTRNALLAETERQFRAFFL
jgi:ethanolamine utilization microcompartment shell protein EutL